MTNDAPGSTEGEQSTTDDSTEQTAEVDQTTTSVPSSDYKVRGKKSATSGTGVLGQNTAASGAANGVEGVSAADGDISNGTYPAGVSGKATGSSRTFGVRGNAISTSGTGVYATAAPDSFVRSWNDSFPTGLTAITKYSSDNSGVNGAAGVEAVAEAGAGEADGLLAVHSAPEGYAVRAIGDTKTGANHEVGGRLDVAKVGVSAYLSQSTSISDTTYTTVPFDATEDDDFANFDDSTGVYTVPADGDYHVDFHIEWSDNFTEGDEIRYRLLSGGTLKGGLDANTTVATTTAPSRCFSKTLFGLTQGESIEVELWQNSGGSQSVFGSVNGYTYFTVHKVG